MKKMPSFQASRFYPHPTKEGKIFYLGDWLLTGAGKNGIKVS